MEFPIFHGMWNASEQQLTIDDRSRPLKFLSRPPKIVFELDPSQLQITYGIQCMLKENQFYTLELFPN